MHSPGYYGDYPGSGFVITVTKYFGPNGTRLALMRRKRKDAYYNAPFPPLKKSEIQTEVQETIIGSGVKVKGEISGKDDLIVHGSKSRESLTLKKVRSSSARPGTRQCGHLRENHHHRGKSQGQFVRKREDRTSALRSRSWKYDGTAGQGRRRCQVQGECRHGVDKHRKAAQGSKRSPWRKFIL